MWYCKLNENRNHVYHVSSIATYSRGKHVIYHVPFPLTCTFIISIRNLSRVPVSTALSYNLTKGKREIFSSENERGRELRIFRIKFLLSEMASLPTNIMKDEFQNDSRIYVFEFLKCLLQYISFHTCSLSRAIATWGVSESISPYWTSIFSSISGEEAEFIFSNKSVLSSVKYCMTFIWSK